jgi:hypothetical protein
MGIFDFLFKGPPLQKWKAELMAENIAMDLYENKYSLQDLVINGEKILEHYFQRDSDIRDCSIDNEQSKQILRLAILYFENDKDYLEKRKQHSEKVREIMKPKGIGLPFKITPPDFPYSPKTNPKEHLTLFKDS